MNGSISYDIVMEVDNSFVEGAFRLAGGEWQVFVAFKRDIQDIAIESTTWESGVTGVVIKIPRTTCLDKAIIQRLLSVQFNVSSWREVRGPDSIDLR